MNEWGEFVGIYVSFNYWLWWVGYMLIICVEQEFSWVGWIEVYFWVFVGNECVIYFYEVYGWYVDGWEKVGLVGGVNDLYELLYV